jgi:hypothetical protein
LTILDDWERYLKEQIEGAEKWAGENPLATGIIIITLASIGTFAASKAYDIWLKS